MTNEEKNVLREAREAVCELQSLDEALNVASNCLFGIPGARIGDESRGAVDPCVKEHLMDQKNNIAKNLAITRLRTSAALMKAEEVIERVKRPKIRAALRYYYVCGKSLRETARLMQRSEKTIKRWFYIEI